MRKILSQLPALFVLVAFSLSVVGLFHACDQQARINQEAAQRHLAGAR